MVFIILTVPENIYFSKSANRVEADTMVLALAFIIPLAFVPLIYPKRFIKFLAGYVVLGFLGYISANFFRNDKVEKELLLNSISTNAVVKEKRYSRGAKGSGYWEFECEFEYHNKIYNTFFHKDLKNKINEGDTLTVLYLQRNPDISKIVMPGDY